MKNKCALLKIVILVFLLFFLVSASVTKAYAATGVTINRLHGQNRYITAVAVSGRGWDSAETVVIARSDCFADALSGVPLAYNLNAPILLTSTQALPPEVITEIRRLEAERAVILGGIGAISEAVARQLEALGLSVERLGGADRYETSYRIAMSLAAKGETAVIVRGDCFADALAIAPFAARHGYPLLLVAPRRLPEIVAQALSRLSTRQIFVAGGEGAVSQEVVDRISGDLGIIAERIGGGNRYETAALINKRFILDPARAFLARGDCFADALAGSVLAARENAALLLIGTAFLPAATTNWLDQERGTLSALVLLGGEGAISGAVSAELASIFSLPCSVGQPCDAHMLISIGDSVEEVLALLGAPQRKDESALGYTWWIYNSDLSRYLQVGIKGGRVVTVYSNGKGFFYGGIAIGDPVSMVEASFGIRSSLSFEYEHASVTVRLSSLQMREQPLIFSEGAFVIFYIDVHDDDRVTAIRLIDKERLLRSSGHGWEMRSTGVLPDISPPVLTSGQRRAVAEGAEKQIFDLANSVRLRNNLPLLGKNSAVADVSRAHSKEMSDYDYFAHTSAVTGKTPGCRLRAAGIRSAGFGENIAMGQSDGPAAHEAWMNSLGHRKGILSPDFLELGVGVYGRYYTQKFIIP